MIGTTVAGRYRIEAQIGIGGMGIVYRAHDTRLRRDVALKVIAPHLMQQETARLRFLREAQALAGLTHPNIVTIYDMADDGDANIVYLVMELLSGQSLRHYLQDGTCPRGSECPPFSGVALPLCRALEAAHARGVLHRDIKPENIFVCDDGTLKLMDFGLARLLGDVSKNQSSTVAGTLAYMAPEQLRGEKLDARADLYALGVVFFEFLTGEQPFTGDNPGTVLLKHLTEPPPHPRDRVPALPEPIDALVTRMMAKEPDARFATAADVRAALEQPLPQGSALAAAVDQALSASPLPLVSTGAFSFAPTSPVMAATHAITASLMSRPQEEVRKEEVRKEEERVGALLAAPNIDPLAAPTPTVTPAPDIVPDTNTAPVSIQNPKSKIQNRAAYVGGGIVTLLVLGLVAARTLPRATPTKDAHAITSLPVKPRQAENSQPQKSATAKSGASGTAGKNTPDSHKQPKPRDSAAGSASASTLSKAEQAEMYKERQEEMALIKKMAREMSQERAAIQTSEKIASAGTAPEKAAPSHPLPTFPVAPALPLPSVADEGTPPPVIKMRVWRVQPGDKTAVHVNLQTNTTCYVYFYMIQPEKHQATRLISGYENFPARPNPPYALRMPLPDSVSAGRGAVLVVTALGELKNLPRAFPLPPVAQDAIPAGQSLDERQKTLREGIHHFSDQVAQQLQQSHALMAGQPLHLHDVVVRLIGFNPVAFGSRLNRLNNQKRRAPGNRPGKSGRNIPLSVEQGNK